MSRGHEIDQRRELIRIYGELTRKNLVKGTSGNVSVRTDEGILITPTGVPCDGMRDEDMVLVRWDGTCIGRMAPSSEWPFHLEILKSREDLGAIVHTHSPFATAVSILEMDIPALHYRIAAVGGATIRCAPYATFGTSQLAERAVEAMRGRRACLLAHHGVIAAHETLAKALNVAEIVEELAQYLIYCLPRGDIPVLPDEEVERVMEKHKTYGQPILARR
ncbi:MAG: class II aldolase/adducin family protein [Rhizobiaceae bacterium]|nr:class II aldolase/adducin family protein [Rhizobiaceae bacterium]